MDAKDLMGKRVTVVDCSFAGANTTPVRCLAPNSVENGFDIESDTLDGVSLRRALATCTDFNSKDIQAMAAQLVLCPEGIRASA